MTSINELKKKIRPSLHWANTFGKYVDYQRGNNSIPDIATMTALFLSIVPKGGLLNKLFILVCMEDKAFQYPHA